MFVLQRANRLGLGGHVSNQPDGSVYVVARGHRARLETLLDDLRRGPLGARVTDVQCDWLVEPDRVEASRFVVSG
jgi:acylphosphatase